MKTSNLLALLFLVLISISANAQNDYQLDNLELEAIFDTLPDGTVINMLDGTFIESSSTQAQLKSVDRDGEVAQKFMVNKQTDALRNKHLKSAQLIKTLNQETSPYYIEKLDSIVEYDAILSPKYDSTAVDKRIQKFNENGYVIETIIQAYDTIAKKYINSTKSEYTPDAEGRILKQFNYNWTGEIWGINGKTEREYNSQGLITLSALYFWTGSGWANQSKNVYEYDTNGNITKSSSYRIDVNGELSIYSKLERTYYDNGLLLTIDNYSGWTAINNNWNSFSHSEYNEQGLRTLYLYMKLNTQTKQLENNYKYEYEYLEDGSILETRFAWNTTLIEFYQQSQSRYKLEKQYQNEKLIQEVRRNYVNGNWEYVWKRVYEYDQWGNEILYELYDPYWGDYGELKEQRLQSFSGFGQLDRVEIYSWIFDENYGYYKKTGAQFYEYKRDTNGKILCITRYKWDKENEDWLIDLKDIYNYSTEGEQTICNYKFNVNGYFADYVKDYVTVLDYDSTNGKYTTIRDNGDEYVMRIYYTDANKVKEVVYYDEGEPDYRIECYYDALGQDSLWVSFYPQTHGNLDTSIYYIQFSYKKISDVEMEVTEFYYDNKPDTIFGENGEILYIDSDELVKYTLKDDNIQKMIEYEFQDGRWIADDSTYFNYNSSGQILSYGDETGEFQWKNEYEYNNDTLTVRYYDKSTYSEIIEWELGDIEVHIMDSNISKNQFQKIPAAIFEDGKSYWYEWHFMFDYGKPLEIISYRKNYNDYGEVVNGDFEISYKTVLFYSPASALQGECTISGFIFDDSGATKSIEITKSVNGKPVEGAVVSLCSREDNYVLATDSTGTDGFYEFKGVPVGNFYLKVELVGYEQTSTYEIEVVPDTTKIENKNFIVMDGEVVTHVDEVKKGINIYPNPASDFVRIHSSDKIISLQVLDMNGRTVLFKTGINESHQEISTKMLMNGLYVVEVKTIGDVYRLKILIKD